MAGLLDLIASGGQEGPTLGETAIGLDKLNMQRDQLDLQRQTTMANLQTLRDKKTRDQQKTDIIASSQSDALRAGGTPEQQQEFFQETAVQRAQQTGRLDIVDDLREAYRTGPSGPQKQKWMRVAELARKENKTKADEAEYKALTERSGKSVAPRATKGETMHATSFYEAGAFNGELENSKQYINDMAAEAKSIQVEAANRNEPMGYNEALTQAEANLSQYVKDRNLTVKLGRDNFSYEPPEGGVSTSGGSGLGDNPTVDEVIAAGEDTARAWMASKGMPEESIEKAIKQTFGKSATKPKGESESALKAPVQTEAKTLSGMEMLSASIGKVIPDEIKEKGISKALNDWLRENQ